MNGQDSLDGNDIMKDMAAALTFIDTIRLMEISFPGNKGKMIPVRTVLDAAWSNPANALFPDIDPAIQFGYGIMTMEEIEQQEEILLREIARCPPSRAP